MGCLNKEKLFSDLSRGWESETSVPTWLGSGEGFGPGFQTAALLLNPLLGSVLMHTDGANELSGIFI